MHKILITGASGFIGKNLIKYFQCNSLNILPFSRNLGMDYKNIDSNYINDEGVDAIIHLAGKAHDFKSTTNDQEYFKVNTSLTIDIFDCFLKSNASTFIYFSSVKAVKDHYEGILLEETTPTPFTAYGKSKVNAENYLISNTVDSEKRIIILRPSMIHGPGNKGNLNLLYKFATKGIPWPLGAFENKRSFCSIDNLIYIVKELIERKDIPSGVYNVADDEPLSTNDVISILAEAQNKKVKIWLVSKVLVQYLAKLGDLLRLPLTTERLQKLTESYVVSNQKIKSAIGKSLQVSAREGLFKTFNSFHTNPK